MPSTISAGTTAGTALNFTSDTTGNLAFQTNGTTTAMTIDTSQNVTFANAVTYGGTIQGTTITATAGFSGNGAAISAINASNVSSGTLASARLPTTGVNASTITAGTLAVAQGGTGAATLTANNVLLGNGTSALQAVAPGSNGNILTSNGSTWVSSAPAAGGVTSVATGNGLSGGTITSTGTLTVACPGFNTVGSYAAARPTGANNSGSNYAITTSAAWHPDQLTLQSNLSGTWKWMAASTPSDDYFGLACRVS